MARVVIIASSKLEQAELERLIEPNDELHVVIPAVEQSRVQWLTNDDDDAREHARQVADATAEAAPTQHAAVQVKAEPPIQLVLDALREHRPDRIVIALRNGDDAPWLEEGELSRIPEQIEGIPVTRIALS